MLDRLPALALTVLRQGQEANVLPKDITGFYLTVYELETPEAPVLVRRVGDVRSIKRRKYCQFSIEKPARLIDHIDDGHRSSWESRNEDDDQWGGAALGKTLAIGISGLKELEDEAISLCLLTAVRDLDEAAAQQIAFTSDNPTYMRLLTAISRSTSAT